MKKGFIFIANILFGRKNILYIVSACIGIIAALPAILLLTLFLASFLSLIMITTPFIMILFAALAPIFLIAGTVLCFYKFINQNKNTKELESAHL
jgi:hypothetical protein